MGKLLIAVSLLASMLVGCASTPSHEVTRAPAEYYID
ncbi:hypothetical protein SAMN06265795_10310 [Noviherbaspirillum humi]|uniref:Lipoprotein n=1 Tax=Noviherbaspirillum humi TaxID=1688639 RepID=A0A239ETG0_9BURK|nr:hypothetical protein SAMN06265795_10310 [Noviherbaspirillum humi]